MSENLKRLREETIKAERRFEYVAKRPKEFAPSQINETVRALNKAREEERRVKEQIQLVEEEKKHLLQNEIKIIKAKADEEDKAYGGYIDAATFSAFPTITKIFKEIAADELNHSRRLKTLADELERELGLYSEKYKAFR